MGYEVRRRGRADAEIMRRARHAPIAVLAALLVTLATPAAAAAAPRATIRWTAHGIPHVLAEDYVGLGYGYGYALASQNLCVIADQYVTVNAQRSRYFGPDESWVFRGNGFAANNLNSDFFFQRIKDSGVVGDLVSRAPPNGPRPEVKQMVRGYVAGYNSYLARKGVGNLPDPTCRGADWVRPITAMDAYRRFYELALLASGAVAIDGIGGAQPPTPPLPRGQARQQQPSPQDIVSGLRAAELPLGGIGSNAYGLGKDATRNHRGMLLGNPHFPWDGSERFFQAQLTIPRRLNVSGASLMGVPLILIGFNDRLAWSHTVSTAYRFTPFEETLVPGSPTTYLYDGQPEEMKRDVVTVKVPAAGGGLADRTRTLYSTRHGPVFDDLVGVPLPWTPATAFTMGDANAANFRYVNHFFETDRAGSVRALRRVLVRNQGIPWVNTIAADKGGEALYADISVVPHVTDEQAAQCNTAAGQASFAALGLPILDGSRSACEWGSDPDAIQPGTFGPSNLPHLFRDDYVANSNDSYWLSNPEHPLEGYDRIIGDERTARSLRTRVGIRQIQQRLDGSDGLVGRRFTLRKLQVIAFGNRQHAGELFRDDLVAMCQQTPILVNGQGQNVNVSAACPVLAAWDLHDNLDSEGAILFRRFASRLLASVGGVLSDPSIYTTPFDAGDPVNTPRGLDTANPKVRQALADAVTDLNGAGIPLDAPLRGHQYEARRAAKVPIHGGPGGLGVFNAINVSWDPPAGYPNVPHGSSYVQAVKFSRGCPDARTILTYSQSTNPDSAFSGDQTRLFSTKTWINPPYTESRIRSDPRLRIWSLGGGVSQPSARFGCAR